MYVARRPRLILSPLVALLLASCTGARDGELANRGEGESEDTISVNSMIQVATLPVLNTACYYTPLPGAFRIFCPGPRDAENACLPTGATLDIQYRVEGEAGTEVRRAAAALVTDDLGQVPSETCVAFDLALLPNAGHKLTYSLGQKRYAIFTYLLFMDPASH